MSIPQGLLNMVEVDIGRIENALQKLGNEEKWKLFRELDGRYQSCIKNWYVGMWQSSHDGTFLYFPKLKDNPQQVAENLSYIKSKLETYLFEANAVQTPSMPSTQVTVTTNVNMNITFEQARAIIEDMTSLTEETTKEALDKVSEIEAVVNSGDSRKSKWEKIKPILAWLADKSFDVAMTILPLLLQVQG